MMTALLWGTGYFALVTLVMVAAHQAEVRQHRARDSEADCLRRELESVPVHAEEIAS
jgi:hypothetical protein